MIAVADIGALSSTTIESLYVIRGELSADAVTKSLQGLLPTRHQRILKCRLTLLDTFDGRVRRAGARLTRSGVDETVTISWQRRGGASITVQVREPVSFVWDLPDGPLREAVAPVIGVRRLFPQVETETFGSRLDVIDERNKTIARLRIESGRARLPGSGSAWQMLPSMITLSGLRGYEEAHNELVPVIESRPGVEACPEGFDGVTLRQLGALPAVVSSPGTDLLPTVLANVGARRIHLALLQTLVANEPGLRRNLDTEFLHDFRVAVRRTRSLLGQIKGVFPRDTAEHFSHEFSWLGRLTAPARDVDVLVLSLGVQREEIPPHLMEALKAFLGQAQQREHKKLVKVLDGDRYRRLVSDWAIFLKQATPLHVGAPNAGRRLADVVTQRAWRLSQRILRRIETIDEHTPAERLHEVRLAAKKLRYLVDVTPALYDAADLQRILSALKKLQRALGDFNDAQVQEQRLLEYGRAVAAAGGPQGTVLALGELAERCRQRRDDLRRQVADGLAKFRARNTRAACRRAFQRTAPADSAP